MDYPRGYLVEAVAKLQNTQLNQAILAYVCNPQSRHSDAIVDYLMLQNVAGNFGINFLGAEREAIQQSLDKLESSDEDEWRKFLLAIKPMGMDFDALKLFSPFDDEQLEQLAA